MEFQLKDYSKYNEDEIMALYQSVGWSNYFNHLSMLKEAYQNSLYTLGAYVDDKLVGIIRTVGDGASILYIQDILVHPDYQRQGIGRNLFQTVCKKYQNVYQKVLVTDDTEKTKSFYKEMGFKEVSEMGGTSFIQYTV